MTTGEDKILAMGSRKPYWDEMTDAQKIERLRCATRDLQRQVNRIGDVVFELAKHKHLSDGKLCIEIPVSRQENPWNPLHKFSEDNRYL